MRLDPRITWDDIEMRMEYIGARAAYNHTIDMTSSDVAKQALKAKTRFINALQTRCLRSRAAFKMLSWRDRKRDSLTNKTRDYVLKQLSADQIANNTTRGSTPGIINPLLPDNPANRVHRRTQSQLNTAPNVHFDVQSGPPAPILAASQQARPPSTHAAALPQPYMHQTATPHLDQLRVPVTSPSAQPSRKRNAPAVSPTPLLRNDTSRVDDEPSDLRGKRAKMTIIDLTQDDETRSDAESFPSNHAPVSTLYADTNIRASRTNFIGPNIVQDTQLDRSPTGIFNRTPSLSSSFPLDPVPTASTPTTITQPPLASIAPTEQEGATIPDPNWAQGWDVFYHDDELAPFTEVGQEYLDWGPTLSDPALYPC